MKVGWTKAFKEKASLLSLSHLYHFT